MAENKYKAMLREIVESWGTPDYWSCDEPMTDCEVRDPRDDNEGVRCKLHDMMKRAQDLLER